MSDWIPVSERLPDESVTVLIADKRSAVFLAWRARDRWFVPSCQVFPTHWMPLPKAPNE